MSTNVEKLERLLAETTRETLAVAAEQNKSAAPLGPGRAADRPEKTQAGTPEKAVSKYQNFARIIDHTLLKPEATSEQITQLCAEARQYHFASVCINPVWVPLAAQLLQDSDVKVCTVIGFPLGANDPEVKAFEAEHAISQGAAEVDMVIQIGALKARNLDLVTRDIRGVVQTAHARNALVKVILETVLLSDEEKTLACIISREAQADFVKTSTGFAGGGATVHDVALMRQVVGTEMGVKASGGVRTFEDVEKMVRAGANRIGASAGVKIIQGPAGITSSAEGKND